MAMLHKLTPEPKGDLRVSILVYFVNFFLPPGILRAERLLDCRFWRDRGRSGGVPSFWLWEGVLPATDCVTGTVYPTPYVLAIGWMFCLYLKIRFGQCYI